MNAADPAHFLVVGDATDLPLLQRLLERLPVDAYGQVFVEVATSLQIRRWDVPHGITVTWLAREDAHFSPARGERAAAAVLAWVAEWMPEEQEAHAAPYVMWIGCSTSTVVDRLYRDLGERVDGFHLHHPHGE